MPSFIEIFNPFFFKLDTSHYIPLILSHRDSLSTAVLLTMNDPNAGGLPTGSWREHMAPHVLFNIFCL